MKYEQVLAAECEPTVDQLTARLAAQGCRIERSFDLRNALANRAECACPYHGLTACECQFLVLLAYDQRCATPPVVVMTHECEGYTRLTLESSPASREVWGQLLSALADMTGQPAVEAQVQA